jgi:hypothetical protein
MQALRFASSGTRASNASLNSADWHQHIAPGVALSITHAFGSPQSGQFFKWGQARLI